MVWVAVNPWLRPTKVVSLIEEINTEYPRRYKEINLYLIIVIVT